jgi:hypothetical protein
MELTEDTYRRKLESGRRMFAWCFERVGGRTAQEAEQAANEFYRYEPPEQEHRWLVFHEEAWHWAMGRLFGSDYFRTHPEYARPSAEYDRESERSCE